MGTGASGSIHDYALAGDASSHLQALYLVDDHALARDALLPQFPQQPPRLGGRQHRGDRGNDELGRGLVAEQGRDLGGETRNGI